MPICVLDSVKFAVALEQVRADYALGQRATDGYLKVSPFLFLSLFLLPFSSLFAARH